MTASSHDEVSDQLRMLVAALRAHAQWQAATGVTGLPRADAALVRRRAAVGAPEPQPHEVGAAAPQTPDAAPAAPADAASPAPSAPTPTARGAVGANTAARDAPAVEPGPAAGQQQDATTGPQRAEALDRLRREVATCTRCGLHRTRTQTVFACGSGSSRLCFVGEGPGAEEDAQGVPFVGAAGQLLDRMIAAMGLVRDEVYICNIVKCRPPRNRKPLPEEMQACRPLLERQLQLIAPEVIVALGATAAEGLLGPGEGITRLRGRWRLYRGQVAVMPTFHPAYLLRNAGAKRAVWEDLQAVLRQLGRPVPGGR
jgi:uracil-DNA glycosylase family 4